MNGRPEFGLYVEAGAALSLQRQLRRKLVDAIERGVLAAGDRIPSSRQMARSTGVSRNTVTLAYDALVAEGYLVSRPRSGTCVAWDIVAGRVAGTSRRRARSEARSVPVAAARSRGGTSEPELFRRPPNWHQHPYPFLDGCIDPSLTPQDEWREALRLASNRREVLRLGQVGGDLDDAMLLDELRGKILTAWDIEAGADEVLVAASQRNALTLTLDALLERGTTVAFEPDLDADLRRRLADRPNVAPPIARDADGPIVPDTIAAGSVLIVGARWLMQGAAQTPRRARDWLRAAEDADAVVIECAPPNELPDAARGLRSLRSLDASGRVLFVTGLAATASLGAPPGVVSASARMIERIRSARRQSGSELASGMQRAWAHFLALGHYRASVARASVTLQARRTALRDALNHYLHRFVRIGPCVRSSAYWVSGPEGMNADLVSRAAASQGVLIEPGGEGDRRNLCIMGVTSIPRERIRAGVELLARLILRDPALGSRQLADERQRPLAGRALHRALAGKTLLYNTVYGDPCTIEVHRDGTLTGTAGYASEDCDRGRWWVDGDRWFRQWQSWAYGESLGLLTVVDGDQVRWYRVEGLLVDTAVIVRSDGSG